MRSRRGSVLLVIVTLAAWPDRGLHEAHGGVSSGTVTELVSTNASP